MKSTKNKPTAKSMERRRSYQTTAKRITEALHATAQKDYEAVRDNSTNPYILHHFYPPHGGDKREK
jgi:hypothetical protein